MDKFFEGIDSDLAKSVKEVVPDSQLSELVTGYSGPDSENDRLNAIASLLSSNVVEQRKTHGPAHEERKKTIEVLGLVQCALQDWRGAAASWQGIVDIDDRESLDDHPDRDLAAMFNLGIALKKLERYPEAEKIYNRLLPMLEAVPKMGKKSQQYVGSLNALMLAVGRQGRVEETRKLYSEVTAIFAQYPEEQYSAHIVIAKKILKDVEHEARER